MAGLRVVRSGEWKWENQDGGEGHCGTTTGSKANAGWINVLWDNGRRNDYRSGANDACDLLVLDNGAPGVFHPGVQCDECDELHVKGLRWKCLDCPDYDLCTECYGNDKHDRKHRFKRIDVPSKEGTNVGRRLNAVKLQSWGLYRGATVVRGENWEKDNQDGGSGSVGTITKIGYVSEENFDKAALVVKWPHNTSQGYIYRRGLGGKVDVKYKTAAKGWCYYRDHLPQLRDAEALAKKTPAVGKSPEVDAADLFGTLLLGALGGGMVGDLERMLKGRTEFQSDQKKETMRKFSVGDLVRLNHDLETVQKLQEGHGSFNLLMVPALGKTGVITEIDNDGDVKVRFGGAEWILNPKALTKQSVPQAQAVQGSNSSQEPKQAISNSAKGSGDKAGFKPGDRVVIIKDIDTAKRMQQGHGGWTDALTPLTGSGVVGIVRDLTRSNDLVVAFGDKTHILNPDICKDASKVKVVKRAKFAVGDWVKLDRDIDFVKAAQKGHGEWDVQMKKAATTPGKIKAIDANGDLRVEFGTNTWTLNPDCCQKSSEPEPKVQTSTGSAKSPQKKNVNEDTTPQVTSRFKAGDRITVEKDVDFVKRKQEGHGGWVDRMKQAMLTVGVVEEVDGDGDLRVKFDAGNALTLNPEVCRKVEPTQVGQKPKKLNEDKPVAPCFKAGDRVTVDKDVDFVKRKQDGHGGWVDRMKQAMLTVGVVEEVDGDGDLRVKFEGGNALTLNPEVCRKAAWSNTTKVEEKPQKIVKREPLFKSGDRVRISKDTDFVRRKQDGHGGWIDTIKQAMLTVGVVEEVDGDGDLRVKFEGGNALTLNPEVCKKVQNDESPKAKPTTKPKPKMKNDNAVEDFIVDDYVQMIQNVEEIKRLQINHGGWNDRMTLAMPHVGRVVEFDEDGDVKVNFNGKNWTLNPAVCRHCDPTTPPTQQIPSKTNRLSGGDSGASSSGPSQIEDFSVGDQVKVTVSLDQLKVLQNKCGGYREEMKQLVAATGLLSSITREGNLVVKFSSGNFTMNPKTCVSLNAKKNKVLNTQGADTRHFKQGDYVKIALAEDSVAVHQRGHGGWNRAMAKALEKVGVVESVESSGDLSVKFGTDTWTFNPEIFDHVDHNEGSTSVSQGGRGMYQCGICLERDVFIVFNCGHTTCDQCSKQIDVCHICRNPIALRTKMFLT